MQISSEAREPLDPWQAGCRPTPVLYAHAARIQSSDSDTQIDRFLVQSFGDASLL